MDKTLFQDYDSLLQVVATVFKHLNEREMSILMELKFNSNKDEEVFKPNSVLCSAVTLNIIKHQLICSSAMFLFNRYNTCVDMIVSCWHMAL